MKVSKLTVKGQVTVPNEIRKRMGVTAGSSVGFDIMEDGSVVLVKIDEYESLAGILKNKVKKNTVVSVGDMNQTIESRRASRGRN